MGLPWSCQAICQRALSCHRSSKINAREECLGMKLSSKDQIAANSESVAPMVAGVPQNQSASGSFARSSLGQLLLKSGVEARVIQEPEQIL